ncbi:translation initiation factor IF-2 [Nitratiruptor sp. SB155-2]|uniref:Translation initiation factor IF-2 n=1 Tax=Nitratiruptor sp. (strain SB155-2) TaxID=387092 RepID=IF2_NITSB|nr:translation initiation factor IF-2 [Nitratiruptor sp. SB155-2]A6Q226.1 RecName: Full=Translation initiation factor IF-2 [Nitratiruptor sp. SB155-2]BAF69535.1 translation initiation factor IF-2 [Nitratiruptor sp. SB155-2]
MDKVRIHEIASELGLKSKDVLQKAQEMGLKVKSPSSGVSFEEAEKLTDYIINGPAEAVAAKPQEKPKKSAPKKEEKPKEEVKKEAEEKVAASKKEEEKPQEKKSVEESLTPPSLKKRRGLVIVKKKRPKVEPKVEEKEAKQETPQVTAEEETPLTLKRKPKKAKKSTPPAKKNEGKKIEILEDRDLSDVSMELEEEVVVLPDFSEELQKVEEEQKPKEPQKKNKQVKVARKSFAIEQQGISRSKKKKRKKKESKSETEIKVVELPEEVRVYEFAEKIGKSVGEVIKVLFNLGMMATKNDFLDKETLEILAEEFDVEIKIKNVLEELDYVKVYDAVEDDYLEERPPVITIMGHVDHGKTSLLDYIRNSKIAEREAGGITQHIGAYMIEKDGKRITFIDTPGHEAFTEMRARGAQATDIAIIVVAADDGVKPQTVEAVNHAKTADVPMIVAINKIDKPEANPDLVKSQLAEIGITPTEWGGEYEFVEVSAKTGQGVDDLLDTILLQAEIMELKANPKREAKAVVIESSLEKGRGPVATVIVKNGTLRVGDHVVCGVAFGRVRAIIDDLGKMIKERKPSEPGVVVGLDKVPPAGEILVAVKDAEEARMYAERRAEYERQKELSKTTKVSLEELSQLVKEGQLKKLPVIIKADTQGSLEAIKGSLEKLKNEEVKVDIIHAGVGAISESDVTLADASENAVILGFNVRPTGAVKEKAKQLGVNIKTYSIIYDLIDDVKALLSGMLSPIIKEEVIGQAEVRETFNVPKIGTVAGCLVTDGVIERNAKARVIRDGVVIYDSKISSLKRFKEDVREVTKGYECGLMIENFNDIKVGDVIEAYKEVEEAATL